MTSFFRTLPTSDEEKASTAASATNVWTAVIAVVAVVLIVGGVIAVVVGLTIVGRFEDTPFGIGSALDGGVATAIVGGVAILLGVVEGTVWLVLGAIEHARRP